MAREDQKRPVSVPFPNICPDCFHPECIALMEAWKLLQTSFDIDGAKRHRPSPAAAIATHWAIIKADGIVIAQGYCRCGDAEHGEHKIEAAARV